jgi:hypothetical protein
LSRRFSHIELTKKLTNLTKKGKNWPAIDTEFSFVAEPVIEDEEVR